MTTCGDLFTARQLVALTTFSDLVQEARERVQRDALAAGLPDDASPCAMAAPARRLRRCGGGVLGVRRRASWLTSESTLCYVGAQRRISTRQTSFGRQAIPMTWDFAEANPLRESVGQSAKLLSNVAAERLETASPAHASVGMR